MLDPLLPSPLWMMTVRFKIIIPTPIISIHAGITLSFEEPAYSVVEGNSRELVCVVAEGEADRSFTAVITTNPLTALGIHSFNYYN